MKMYLFVFLFVYVCWYFIHLVYVIQMTGILGIILPTVQYLHRSNQGSFAEFSI